MKRFNFIAFFAMISQSAKSAFFSAMSKNFEGVKNSLRAVRSNRKGMSGGINFLIGIGMGIVILAAVLGLGGMLLSGMKENVGENETTAISIFDAGLSAIDQFGGWMGMIVTVAIFVVIFFFLGYVKRSGAAVGA